MADTIKIKACTGDNCLGQIYFNPKDKAATGTWTPFDAISNKKHEHYYAIENAPAPAPRPEGLTFAEPAATSNAPPGTPVNEDEAIAFAEKCVKSYLKACLGDGSEGENQVRPDNCNTVFNTAIMQKMRK